MNELDFYNPELELVEANPKRRRRRKNPEPIAVATPLLLALAGYAGWCWWVSARKSLPWNWQPWKRTTTGRRLLPARPIGQNYRDLDRSIEQMMAPAYSVVEKDIWKKPTYRPVSEETVSFITP